MSVKFTVELELPLEDVANIQAGITPPSSELSTQAVSKATIEAIRALPYRITTASTAVQAEEHATSVKATSTSADPLVPIHVKTSTGEVLTFNGPLSTTIQELKSFVFNKKGYFPGIQRLVFEGQVLGKSAGYNGEVYGDLQSLESVCNHNT